MKAINNPIMQIIFAEIKILNGENTEEALIMSISEQIMTDISKEKTSEIDKLNEDINEGAWVHANSSLEDWVFERYDTIEEAIKHAVKMVNAQIISNGQLVMYDALSDKEAYYLDNLENKLKVVAI